MSDGELFQRANQAADMEKVAGVDLKRSGTRLRGPCPLCGGDKLSTRFWADPKAKRWGCFGCGEKGDAVDLYARLQRLTPREAAERLAGPEPISAPKPRPAPAPAKPEAAQSGDWKRELAARLWREAKPAAATPVEAYLRGRGISGPVLDAALRQLRYHPRAYHSGSPRQPVTAPAMIGLVRTPLGPTGGVHVTYLAPGGRGKARLDPAKRMWGPQGRDMAPGGVWLSHPAAAGGLVVAEGIESALSAAMLLGEPRRVVAALSLGHLQGGWLADKWGRVDPDMIRPDPDKPAFTWPEDPAAPWGEVAIAVDRDMKPVRVRVRKGAGGTAEREIDGEARGRICGALACAAWRRTGPNAVRSVGPAPGRDFNDELRARLEARGEAA